MKNIHISTWKPLSRRAMLKGLGVSLSLPALEAMSPVYGATAPVSPKRMLLVCYNLGFIPEAFFPKEVGKDYRPSPYLEALQPWRDHLTVFSGLSHPGVGGGHPTDNCFLSGARGPGSSGFKNSISLDLYAAELLGRPTRFPNLSLGVNVDPAQRSLTWTRSGAMIPAAQQPSEIYRSLFLTGSEAEMERQIEKLRQDGSVLDAVNEQLKRFGSRLSQSDQDRLDHYTTSIREVEKRLVADEEWERKGKPATSAPIPPEINLGARQKMLNHTDLMFDMIRLAFETDSTRIVSLMIDEFNTPALELEKDSTDTGFHNITHHGQAEAKLNQWSKIDSAKMQQLARLFETFSKTSVGSGSLLDNTMILCGSNMGDANTHDNTNLPILLAGGGLQHGQHLAFNRGNNKPLCNLFVTMLQHLGIEADTFGSSTGTLNELNS